MFADLHIHTDASDGTYSPETVLRLAAQNGVKLLSVCDHERLQGSKKALALAVGFHVRVIAGVEIDALWQGHDLHILGLDIDTENAALCDLVHKSRAALEGMSDVLLDKMAADGYPVSAAEFHMFAAPVGLGGWPALHYLEHKGVCASWQAAKAFYAKYHVRYEDAPFFPLGEVCAAIRGAGGCAILAHPGATKGFAAGPQDGFEDALRLLVDEGVQGLECHYPTHGEELTAYYRSLCDKYGLYISAGSDCHGEESHAVGCLQTPISALRLPFAG